MSDPNQNDGMILAVPHFSLRPTPGVCPQHKKLLAFARSSSSTQRICENHTRFLFHLWFGGSRNENANNINGYELYENIYIDRRTGIKTVSFGTVINHHGTFVLFSDYKSRSQLNYIRINACYLSKEWSSHCSIPRGQPRIISFKKLKIRNRASQKKHIASLRKKAL